MGVNQGSGIGEDFVSIVDRTIPSIIRFTISIQVEDAQKQSSVSGPIPSAYSATSAKPSGVRVAR